MANIFIDVAKKIEVGAEDLWNFLNQEQKVAPAQLAALGVLGGAIDKAIGDVVGQVANPASIVVEIPTDIGDIKAVWADAKAALATLGVKL